MNNTDASRIVSVSEFTEQIKQVLENSVSEVWIRGEVSNLRRQSSGHLYFTLKDQGAQISGVVFRGDAVKQSVQLKDGMQLIAYGRIGVYAPRGNYQLIIRHYMLDGLGRLQQAFEALKQKLAVEGLFATENKKPIPRVPKTVGVITSPSGAALRDFISVLQRRGWCGRIVVFPSRVQGLEAADEIIEQLEKAQAMGGFDLLVLTRGGGSIEDLWCFNEERLVRAIAACNVPVISAVGHEIDFTLSDFVADLRAETPTAAAEFISSSFIACRDRTLQAQRRFQENMARYVERSVSKIALLEGRLSRLSPRVRLEFLSLRVDECSVIMDTAIRDYLRSAETRLLKAGHSLALFTPEERVRRAGEAVAGLHRRITRAAPLRLVSVGERLQGLEKRFTGANYKSVLKRGYTIMRDENERVVSRAAGLATGQLLTHEFEDGIVHSKVVE